ncbi:UNVERIFIED_CONTAM: hypothetical protein FKN15_038603 [Acipenser sinensis]
MDLQEHSAPPLEPHGVVSTDWPQEDKLSITTSEEVADQELAFPSEDVESDGTSPVVKLSLSAELILLIKRATATLQVQWPALGGTRQSIFDDEATTSPISPPVHLDFLYEIQSSWDHPAMAPAVSCTMDTIYMVHDAEKLGLAHFLPVEANIAALVQAPNLVLLSKDTACQNKQCWVFEVILKRAYSAGAFATQIGNYTSILIDCHPHLLLSLSMNHRHHNSWMSCSW